MAQKKWLKKFQNRDHFRGIAGLENTRNWRQKHPGYWRRKIVIGGNILEGQLADVVREFALQDMIDTHFYLVAGLISRISKSALQDTIANELRRLIVLGRGILKDTTRAAAWRKFGSRET